RIAIHTYFGLSYANYLVVPRALLQSMPIQWQEQFTGLLNELDDTFRGVPQAQAYDVTAGKHIQLKDMTDSQLRAAGVSVENDGPYGPTDETRYHRVRDGQEMTGDDYGFVPGVDPVPHYNRGRTRVPSTTMKEI
ncbi:hypothetical protein XF35_40315, partial [Streptomyces platensis subsp. clarensis]|nr:hypothetical protein [Streptomyces platensis subsp. clarensis]